MEDCIKISTAMACAENTKMRSATEYLNSQYAEGWNDACNCIKELISLQCPEDVEPPRRWIPCSERLPEELVPVNVVWKNDNPPPYYSKIRGKLFFGTGVFYGGNWYWYSSICIDLLTEFGNDEFDSVDADVRITHWQPIPEPPEEGGNKNAAD